MQKDDLIDRQAAIDALSMMQGIVAEDGVRKGISLAWQQIKDLRSAQPEVIRCKDCKNWDTTWQNDWAKNYHYCPLIDGTRNGDWYCADAERREE